MRTYLIAFSVGALIGGIIRSPFIDPGIQSTNYLLVSVAASLIAIYLKLPDAK